MLTGSVAGGYLAQATNLGVPYLLRALVLALSFGFAFVMMRDIGFAPKPTKTPMREARRVLGDAITYGLRQPRAAMADGGEHLRRRGVDLRLLRDAAVPVRSCTATLGRMGSPGWQPRSWAARRSAAGCWAVPPTSIPPAHVGAAGRHVAEHGRTGADRLDASILDRDRPSGAVGARVRHRGAGPSGLRERSRGTEAPGDRAVVRLAHRLGRRSRDSADPGQGGGPVGLSARVRLQRVDPGVGRSLLWLARRQGAESDALRLAVPARDDLHPRLL